jgi:hypothetical protein
LWNVDPQSGQWYLMVAWGGAAVTPAGRRPPDHAAPPPTLRAALRAAFALACANFPASAAVTCAGGRSSVPCPFPPPFFGGIRDGGRRVRGRCQCAVAGRAPGPGRLVRCVPRRRRRACGRRVRAAMRGCGKWKSRLLQSRQAYFKYVQIDKLLWSGIVNFSSTSSYYIPHSFDCIPPLLVLLSSYIPLASY